MAAILTSATDADCCVCADAGPGVVQIFGRDDAVFLTSGFGIVEAAMVTEMAFYQNQLFIIPFLPIVSNCGANYNNPNQKEEE
eukprot:4870102-Ditylum_brightwellii.AAC.1